MHPQSTNVLARTLDVYRICFGCAGALEFINEYAGHGVGAAPIFASQNSSPRMSLAENLTWGELHDEHAVGWTF